MLEKIKTELITTTDSYSIYQKQFNVYVQKNGGMLDQAMILNYLDKLKEEKSASTFNLARQALKHSLLKMSPNPVVKFKVMEFFKEIKNVRILQSVRSSFFTEKEIVIIFNSCKKDLQIISQLLLDTGLRVSELINIKHSDINFKICDDDMCQITIIGKGSKQRHIFIKENLYNECKKTFKVSKWLICNFNGKQINRMNLLQRYSRLSKKLNIEIYPHKFRHTFTKRTIDSKKLSIKAVSKYLGHESVKTTLDRYYQSLVESQDMADQANYIRN